jgi:hypothetical protein
MEVGDGLLQVLARHCSDLRSLRLEQTYVGDEGVGALVKGCRQLQELRVAGCSPHCWMLPAELMFPGETGDTGDTGDAVTGGGVIGKSGEIWAWLSSSLWRSG